MQQDSYTLFYFSGRGKAELIRWILACAGVAFKDRRLKLDEWLKIKSTHPDWQLPILFVNDEPITHSLTISCYLARKFHLAGKTAFEADEAETVVSEIAALTPYFEKAVRASLARDHAQKKKEWLVFKELHLRHFLERMDAKLSRCTPGTKWLMGPTFTWADIALAELLNRFEDCFDVLTLKEYPRLRLHMTDTMKVAGIRAWVSDIRPERSAF